MTEEEIAAMEEKEERMQERKARYKKFDFAEFVNRDAEPSPKPS